jgi:hypothetical protein
LPCMSISLLPSLSLDAMEDNMAMLRMKPDYLQVWALDHSTQDNTPFLTIGN